MRVELGMKRGSKNKDPKLALIRRADTDASSKHGIGGRPKVRGQKPVTLPKFNFKDA